MEPSAGDDVQVPGDDVVDPWTVSSSSDKGVDYDKLISMQFSVLSLFYDTSTEPNDAVYTGA